jgi:L-lysine exporter family protein LysE/ArgO
MTYIILGFLTGLSLILAIGAQNIFVIEQGLKKEFIFIVCLICSISDFLLIFLGIFVFHYFQNIFTPIIELSLNILLLIFLIYFIWSKIKIKFSKLDFKIKKKNIHF